MMKRRHGRIINISSVVGTTATPVSQLLCSKSWASRLQQVVGQRVAARGITVNCVSLGLLIPT